MVEANIDVQVLQVRLAKALERITELELIISRGGQALKHPLPIGKVAEDSGAVASNRGEFWTLYFKCATEQALETLRDILQVLETGHDSALFQKMKHLPIRVFKIAYPCAHSNDWKAIRLVYGKEGVNTHIELCSVFKNLIATQPNKIRRQLSTVQSVMSKKERELTEFVECEGAAFGKLKTYFEAMALTKKDLIPKNEPKREPQD